MTKQQYKYALFIGDKYDFLNVDKKTGNDILDKLKIDYMAFNEIVNKMIDYKKALRVWNVFNIKNMGEYHDLYLETDVMLLSDVFLAFRNTAIRDYNLDPCNQYITLPHFSWDAMLYKTKTKLEKLTDINMYLMCERGIRGGISMISNRYAKANNKYMTDYNKDIETSYIQYLDANNLYGGSMSEKLPYGKFHWVTPEDIDLTTYDSNGVNGVIVEVDLEYPQELHDEHNDYPLAPENKYI